MSTKPIIDYLTKEIAINRNIVTFRLLSRQFSIHVNEAKNELLTYYTKSRESEHVYATYLVSGDVAPKPRSTQSTDDSMDIDEDVVEDDDGEEVPMSTMILVSEKELESTKASLANIRSCHVYCLSPSPLKDAGFICDPTYRVREIDNSKDNDFHKTVGRIISPEVKLGKGKAPAVPSAKTSKLAAPAAASTSTSASTSASRSSLGGHTFKLKKEEPKEEPEQAQKVTAPATAGKTKITAGTLNWNKAKPKATVKDEPAAEPQLKSIGATTPVAEKTVKPKEDTEQKRGAKRKSDVMMQSSSKVEVSTTKPPSKGPVVKKGVVLSDDEDEQQQPNRSKANIKGKQKVVVPDLDYLESEKSLRAMMDIDDSEVIKVSRSPQPDKREEEEEPIDENAMDIDMPNTDADDTGKENDIAMDDDDSDPAPKTKPRKRKPKKVIPVGRNGLKKKRIVKSRMTTDEKGYMVTEDYSEYESVDEEEAQAETSGSKLSKGKAESSVKDDKAQKSLQKTEEKKSIKPVGSRKSSTGGAGGGKKNLMNYFGGANKT